MKKIHMIAALLAMLLPTMLWAGGDSTTYYAALKAQVSGNCSGMGKVYAGTSNSTPSASSYNASSSQTSAQDSTTKDSTKDLYAFALPNEGYEFVGWSRSNNGSDLGKGTAVGDAYRITASVTFNSESSPNAQTWYATFKEKVLDAFSITFETSANGTYTVDGSAPANKTGLTKATSVVLASSDSNFLNWNINGTVINSNPYTLSCTANTTVGADFLTADQVTSVTTLAELTSALSNAAYKKIIVPSGTSIIVAKGSTVTVPAGKQLVVDGTLNVLGTVSNSGTISGNGTLYKVSQLITQGDVKTLYNGKGDALGNVALRSNTGKPAKYRTTTVTANSPTVSGTVSCTTSWGAMLNGSTVYAITTQTPKVLNVTLRTTACVNEITAITGTITGDITANGDYLLIQNCNLKGPTVKEGSNNQYTRLDFHGTIDCAGKKLTSNSYQFRYNFTGLFLNGSIEFGSSSNYMQQPHAAFFNCSSVTLTKIKNAGATFYFYDCGSSGSPATISYSYYDNDRTTNYRNAYYYCGVYDYTFSSGNDTDMSHVYGGSYKTDPTPYLYNVDEVEAVYNQTTKYYDVREKREPTYVCVIGTAQYESLTEAVTAAGNGAKIALTAAIDLTGSTLTISGKSITISLDKHTVTGGKIVNNGALTLVDLTDANQGTLESDIENNGTIDVTYGTYSGNILLNTGTFTTHGGVFTGTISAASGVDLPTVANLRGGKFAKNPAEALRSGYSAPKFENNYWVGEFPAPIVTSTTYSGTDKAWKMDFLSSADLALYSKQTDKSEFSSDADWKRRAELESSIHPYDNYVFDCALIFDRAVDEESVTFAGKTQMGITESLDKNLAANTYYPVLAKRIEELGSTAYTFKRTILEIKSATAGVKNNLTANNGVVCILESRLSQRDGSDSSKFNKVYALSQQRYMLGGKKAAIDRGANRLAYDSLAAAVNAAQSGERILIGADCSENVTLPGAGTFTVDPYGFAFTGTVSIPSTCFLKSQEEVASSATAQGVASAKAVTYVVALKVAQVGGQFYDNLTEAVAAANGAVVTLLAATDEIITLTTEGQSFTLNKNGVEFDDAKVVTTVENGSVTVSAGDSGTVYTAVTSVLDASDGNTYTSVTAAVTDIDDSEISVTVTANVTEEVELPQGKALVVTTVPGVTVNLTVEPADGAFLVESEVEGGTKYESKKITVEMAEPVNTSVVEMEKIENNGETNTVSDASLVNAAVAALMNNADVPRTDNTDKLDVVDKITVTPTKIVQEVVGAAPAIIRAATFDVVPTKAGQPLESLGEGQKLKFRLPVDAAATQLASIIYHNGEQFGVYPVQTENGQKFVEVESDAFSPYGYELLDGETENPIAAIGTTGYATLGAAIEAASNGDTITVFAGTFDIGSDTIIVNKQVTITGAGKDTTILNSSVSGKGAFSIAADNVTIEDLTISLSNNSDMTRAINVGNKPQTSVVSNTTLQRLKFVGGRNALSVYASNLTIDSCDFSEQYRDAILLYTVQGTSAITGNTFVQTTPGGQGFIYGTSSDGTDPLSSGTLTISGNTATGGRCLYHCNNQDRFDTTTKMTLDIVGNLATDYNNKGIVFAGHESTPLSSIFNSITITNNTLFTSANRPAIQRDDTDTSSLAIDASGNYWGSASPDFDTPMSGGKYLIEPHTDSNNVVVDSYGTTYTPNSSSPGATVNNLLYKVTFVDEDSTTILYETNLASGNTPVYGGTTPTKAATAQYTFTWNGWTYGGNTYGTADTLAPVADAAQTYTATYSSVVNDCTVTVTIPANSTITVKQNGAAISPDAGTDNAFTVPYGTELTVEYAATGAYIAGGTQSQVVTADSTKTVAAPNDYSVVPAVAQIGSTYYPTLAAAITDANAGNTITMLADVTLMANMESNYALWIDKSVVIDGCNHVITISGNRRGMGIVGSHDVSVTNVVTLQNLSIVSASNQDGKLIFTQCNSSNGLYLELNMSSVTLNARNASAPMTQPLTISGQHSDPITVNITDSAIDAGDNGVAITIYNPAIMTITGSEISAWMGIGARYYSNDIRSSGTVLTIDDCTLNGINKYTSGDADQAIISVYDEGVTVNVTDTDFNVSSTGSYTEFAVAFFGGRSTVTSRINLGEGNKVLLEGDAEIADEYYNESDEDTYTFGRVAISGGVFSDEPPSACLAEGYTVTSNEDPATEDDYWYAVVPAVAKIVSEYGTDYFATLEEAIDAADIMEVSSITILDDSIATSPDQGWNIIEDGGEKYLVRTTFYNVWVGGTQITSANAADVFGNGKVSYDDATKTLTLNGYTYSGAGYGSSAVYIGDMGGATFNIVVAGENSLTSTATYGYAIRSVGTGAVTVTGSGANPSLALTVPSTYDTGYAVSVKGTSATFKDLSMAVTGYLGIVVNGNNAAGDALTIDNCDIVFDGTAIDQAIWVYNPGGDGTVSIENGSSLTGKGAILVYGYGTSAGDANLSITDSTVSLTGATTASASGSSRHAIEVLSNVGDSVLTIDNSTVTVTASNGLHPNGNGPDGINVGSQNSVSGKGLAKIDIKNGSVVTATGNANGVNLFTWGSSGINQSGAELSVVDSTLNASATHETGGHYGIVAYAYQKGDTSVVFENSTVNASAPATAAICLGAGEKYNNQVGNVALAAEDSAVTMTGPYGLLVSTISEGESNTDSMQTVDISGGSFTCNGLLFVYGDDGENTASVSMSGVTAQIGTTEATEEPVTGTITTGALEIESGDYTIRHGSDLNAFDVADGDISGGTFNEKVPEDLCADSYIPTELDPVTGKYTVKTGAFVARNMGTGTGYETLYAAVRAASVDDTVALLTNVVESITINKNITLKSIDPANVNKITGTLNIDEAATVTMDGVELDGNGSIYALNIAGGSTVNVTNVTVGGGVWCNIHLNNGTLTGEDLTMLGEDLAVEADGLHYTYRGERLDASETPPFGLDVTKIPGQTVTLPFMDIVRENSSETVTLAEPLMQGASMLFVANMPGEETQTGVTLPARFGCYSVTIGAVVSVFGDDPDTPVMGWGQGDWNEIIDTGAAVLDSLATEPGQSSDDVDVTLTMNSDVDLGEEPFVFKYENLTIDGGSNTVSGTIKYTDNAGTIENVTLGTEENPLVLDMTEVTVGEPINLGVGISASNVTIKVTEEQIAEMGTTIVTWNTEGQGEGESTPMENGITVAVVDKDTGEPAIDEETGLPKEASLVWDDDYGRAYVGPCEARLTGPTHDEPIYTTLADAIARAAQSNDTVTLMADISNITTTLEIKKSLTIDGAGHSITAGVNSDPRSVFMSWGGSRMMFDVNRPETTVTFTDITLDNGESHYFTFLVRAKNGADGYVVFDDVTLLNGGEADASGTDGVGYGAAVQVDGGNVIVNGDFYSDSHGAPAGEGESQNGGIFPFTAILYQTGGVHFNDGVNVSIGSDLLLVGMEGAVDASTDEGKAIVQGMLDAMNVPAGYAPYTLKLGDGDSLATSFTGASPLAWNDIIDYGKDIMDVSASLGLEMDKTTTPVEVGLLDDTVLDEPFVYEDSNFTVNGNGNALSGTIEYTDDAGTLENVVMGTEDDPLVLDMTGLSEGKSMDLGSGISASNVTIKVTEEQVATMGTTIVTWNTEDQGEGEGEAEPFEAGITVSVVDKDTGEPVIDDETGQPKEASLVWDDEYGRAYVGPCEARLTGPNHADPIYTSLAHAIELADQSGDTVTLMMDIENFSGKLEISKEDLVLDGAGHTISAAPVLEHRGMIDTYFNPNIMFKLWTGDITIRNITLDGDATHAYTYFISADNSSVHITTENVSLLNGGELSATEDPEGYKPGVGYGAAIHLNNGASLVVSNGFYACTGGETSGVFPFTGILVDEHGALVSFELEDDSAADPKVGIGNDLLLVGVPGAIPVDEAQTLLDYMKVPSRFIPYTLTLGDGSAYAFTGASPLPWNEIIDYGKEIMEVSTAIGYEGLVTNETPVEVGLLTDTVLPDTFTYEDSNFTVNGNGNALSGTIEYTDNAGVIEDIVFGTEEAPLVLDLRNVTDPVEIGRAISVTNVTVLMTEEQAQLGQPVFTWNTETAEEPDNSEAIKITVMPDAQSEPTGDEPTKGLVWDDEMGVAYIGPCEARLTGLNRDPGYMDLTNAFKYAVSGDVITLFWSNVTLNASVTLPAGNLLFTTNKYELAVGEDAEFVFTNATSVFRTELDVLDELVLDGDCATGYLLRYEEEGSTNKYSVAERGIYIVTGNTEDGSEGTATIKVSDEWVAANVGDNIRTANEVEDVLNSADTTTGMRKWEAYVLKQTTAPFKVTSVNASNDSLTTSLGDPEETETTGFTVAYSLAEADASGVVVNPGTPVSSRNFTVPVDEVTSNAFYRVRAHLTSGGSTLVVDSTNTIGVLKVDSVRSQTILAVPWADIGSGEDVAVSDLMRTKTLTEGDTLYAYDAESGKYKVWELSASKEWEPIAVSTKEDCTPGESAGLATVKRGTGLWLERANPTAALHLVGEVSTSSATSSLVAASEVGKDGKQGWNVVAPPSALPYDLNSITPAGGSFGTYDRIVIPTTGAPKNYTYENGSWGYYSMQPVIRNGVQVGVRSVFNTEDTVIPAGTGFWYLNSGNSTTVTW